jgi:hypothetical protein
MIVEVRQHVSGEGDTLIARIEDFEGPLPGRGDSLFHPPLDPAEDAACTDTGMFMNISGQVADVTWLLYGRPRHGEKHFTRRDQVVVEVRLRSI